MTKKILVTGGSGFIGSEAIRTLTSLGYNVFNIDKLTYASSNESLELVNKSNYTFYEGDIADEATISNFIKEISPECILNFAAESHVDRSIEDADDFINTNILGTYNLLKYSSEILPNLISSNDFRFIHISTDEVYGSLGFDDEPFNEDSSFKPNSPYSASKASSDMLVRSWIKTYNFPAIITHSSNNYGPWQFPEKLIPRSVLCALNEEPIQIYGDGSNIRDWIFVEDNVRAIIELMKNGNIGETYNIGSENEVSNIGLVKEICNILDDIRPRSNGSYSDLIVFVEDRPGHDLRYAIDINKITSTTSWRPIKNVHEGLRISIEWMIDNRLWLLKKATDKRRLGLKKK